MISIITSLYNSNKHLKKYAKCIEKFSIHLSKLNIDHEFIIIANDPDSNEKDGLEKIKSNKRIKSKIAICKKESLYTTWNRGINEATYPIISFWNVDDIRYHKAIVDGINIINNGADLVYSPFIYKRFIKIFGFFLLVKIKKIEPPEFNKKSFIKEMHCGPFFMVKKSVFTKIGYFDESFRIAGDFEWCARAAYNDLIIKKYPTVGGIFTNNGETLSGSKNMRQQEENSIIINKFNQ